MYILKKKNKQFKSVNIHKGEIIVVELSIPFESWMEEHHEYKTSKYEHLKNELEKERIFCDLQT